MLKNHNCNPADTEFRHFTPVQIRFNDIDIMGHVNNAIFQDYFDFARLGYFKEVFGHQLSWDDISLIIAGISIDYHQTLHLEDNIVVASRTSIIGNKSIRMVQEIKRLPGNTVTTCSNAVLVAFDAARNCSVQVPAEWRERIIGFEKTVDLKQGAVSK